MSAIVHTHWLYGMGPKKILTFKHPIRTETDCLKCLHKKVCSRDMTKRCANYDFGTSAKTDGCLNCTHRFTRYDKEWVPCFRCHDFRAQRAEEKTP